MKLLRLALFLTLTLPPAPPPLPAALMKDCAVCGHACCCPEMCKPLIEKMKKEKAKRMADCGQTMSHCRLGAPRQAQDFSTPTELRPAPNATVAILDQVDPRRRPASARQIPVDPALNSHVLRRISTPPPRQSA